MIVSVAEARRRFSDLLKRVAYGGQTVVIGSRGKPQAALVSIDELERLHSLEMERDAELLERAVHASKGTVEIQELLRAWGRAEPSSTGVREPTGGRRYRIRTARRRR